MDDRATEEDLDRAETAIRHLRSCCGESPPPLASAFSSPLVNAVRSALCGQLFQPTHTLPRFDRHDDFTCDRILGDCVLAVYFRHFAVPSYSSSPPQLICACSIKYSLLTLLQEDCPTKLSVCTVRLRLLTRSYRIPREPTSNGGA